MIERILFGVAIVLVTTGAEAFCKPTVVVELEGPPEAFSTVTHAIEDASDGSYAVSDKAGGGSASSPSLELVLVVASSRIGRPPNIHESWCLRVRAASSFGDPVTLDAPLSMCASGENTYLGTDLPPPSRRGVKDGMGAPLGAAIARWAATRRTLTVTHLLEGGTLMPSKGAPRVLRAAPTAMIDCLPAGDATLAHGKCTMSVPADATAVDIPAPSSMHLWLNENSAGAPQMNVSNQDRTEFTIKETTQGGTPIALPCGGQLRLSVDAPELTPGVLDNTNRGEEWRWSVKSQEGVATVRLSSTAGGSVEPDSFGIQLTLPLWRRVWFQIAAVLGAVATVITVVQSTMKFFPPKKKDTSPPTNSD